MARPARPALLIVLGLWLALPALLSGAPPARFTRIGVEQGLSQSTVHAIVQDHVGFLWFGTEEGLNRFDGYSFVVFKSDRKDPRTLSSDHIWVIHEDRQRRLWVGTGAGLSVFDRRTETFEDVMAVGGSGIAALAEDPDGTLWVATGGHGLFARDPATGKFRRYVHDPAQPDSLASNAVSSLCRDRRGRLWIGTRDTGLDRLEDGRFVHHRRQAGDPRSLSHDEVWGLAEDDSGRLWVATYGGGLSVRDETGTFRQYRQRAGDPRGLESDFLTEAFVDRAGTVWIGTDGAGVLQYDAAADRFQAHRHDPGDPASLSQNVVRALYEDAQGQVWVGTYQGGVDVLRRPRHAFGHVTHRPHGPTGLSDPAVTSFLEDAQGRLWVGMQQGWLNGLDPRTGELVRYRYPSGLPGGSALLALLQDRRGRFWVGTYRGGLGRFDPERGTFVTFQPRPGDQSSLVNDEVWALAEAPDGSLWLGTNGGLDRFDPERGVVTAHYTTLNTEGLGPSGVRTLVYDRQGNLWIGTFGGLHVLRPGQSSLSRYLHDPRDPGSLGHDGVVALHEDRRGFLWVGTFGGGLQRRDPTTGTFTPYRDFPSNVILGIEEDASGRLWLSTNHGLSRFDPATGRIDKYDLTNGLQSLQFHLGASLKTRAGRLLFGSVDGYYDFDPQAIQPDTYAPPVVFTSLRAFNEPVKLPVAFSTLDDITLSYRDKVFSFEFAALDYTFPRRNQYAYRMEGFNDQWIQLGGRREVTFTNLDPGTYVFQAKASNSDGVWNEAAPATLRVTIEPPLWGTWWFRGLALLLLGLGLLGVHRRRVGQLTADLGERTRAEQALREAEERYRSIFENAVEGIFQSTPDGRFLTINPAHARTMGYASPEQMKAEVTDIEKQLYVDPARRGAMTRLLEEQGIVHGFESELRRRDGSTVWISTSLRVVRDAAGNVLYYEGTSEDISDRRRAQELQESLRRSQTLSAMGSLVAGVAHEVRNPLFGISSNLDAFEASVGTAGRGHQMVSFMRREVNRLTDLMRDLLDYGKPVHAAPVPGSIAAVVSEAVQSCVGLANRAKVEVRNDVTRDLPSVLMDRERLLQVFQNILQNAIQHTPAGGVVSVEAFREDGLEPPAVVLTVKDTGPGVPPVDLPRIFEPFFSRRRGGTGLGLAIVQRIVEEHGGTVSMANRPEGGAVVKVRLQCAPPSGA